MSSSEREPLMMLLRTATDAVVAASTGALPTSSVPSNRQSESQWMLAPDTVLDVMVRSP